MNKYLLLFLTLMQLSCAEKDLNYWIIPDNQNGNISGFYATSEYCDLMRQNCPEFKVLSILENKINDFKKRNKSGINPTKTDSLTEVILEQLDLITNDIVLNCGGYCAIEDITSLPILPYRKDDIKSLWTEQNIERLKLLIEKHISKIEMLNSLSLTKENDSILKMISNINEQNTINGMIMLRSVQLELIELNKTLQREPLIRL